MRKKDIFRHELKFVLNLENAEWIRNIVDCVCSLDENAKLKGFYEIKSIYFDTLTDKCFYETLDGVDSRHKYRVRKYGQSDDCYKFEKKIAENGLKLKKTDIITRDQLSDILSGNIQFGENDSSVISDFATENLLYMYRPAAVIGYKRIPYVYPMGNVRITFDSRIVVTDDIDYFFEGSNGLEKEVLRDRVVLEIKYDEFLPMFLRDVLNGTGLLEQSSFSKYAAGRNILKYNMEI